MNPRIVSTVAELNDLAGSNQLSGVFRVPIEIYHEGPGISSSGIKELLKSPAHYQAYLAEEQEDSPSLRFGRLMHMALLEPDLYQTNVLIRPDVDARTKDGKATLAEFAEVSKGKEVVTMAENLAIHRVLEAAHKNKLARAILAKGYAEISVYWQDEATGVLCKARADWLRGDSVFDLKTCYSAKPEDFKKAVQNYRYDLSAAFYLDGFQTVFGDLKHFAWMALEKSAPYCMGFYAATEETLSAGRADYVKALLLLAECQAKGEWPGYEEAFQNLSLTGA